MMSMELSLLGWSTALGMFQLGLAATAARQQDGFRWAMGPRDTPPPPLTGIAGRLSRARVNFMETFPFFAAAILAVHAAGREGTLSLLGAEIYFWARLLYLPAYVTSVGMIRPIIWSVSFAGLLLVLLALAGG